eukprot:comp38372_c0_seq1/m.47352 comp38372_c0_seq1/g.47352  ORF comp38372_c0_seq1/g.47352 comp38372_c0_seq1/m.47352 type:complete len:271 (-) comp38372_c0_seq1:155-967(-)
MLIHESYTDLKVGDSVMRVHLFKPACDGTFAGVIVYSEIYQVTGPVSRICRLLASEGFIVAAPEVYHDFEVPGTVLNYDDKDTDKGNAYKIAKPVGAYDADARAVVDYLKSRKDCNGRIGSVGLCLGGHLAFRCAFEPEVIAAVCFFATDIHTRSLGKGGDDSLERVKKGDLKNTELLMVFGKQDNHTPRAGIREIKDTLEDNNVDFAWCELNARHAFLRDESSKGRYDASLTRACQMLMLEVFHRRLTLGCPSSKDFVAQSGAAGPENC